MRSTPPHRRVLLGLATSSLLVLGPAAADARAADGAGTWFVSAGAGRGGEGSRGDPFGSLARVEKASHRGDTIIVLPSRRTLDGGIVLKPGQRLVGAGHSVRSRRPLQRAPRVTNTKGDRHSGDAVVLASGVTVRNLAIANTHRGAIYGKNVRGVRIIGNDVSGQNVSCEPGFHIQPFVAPTNSPGVGIPISDGLHNGWAAIMVDADRGRGIIRIHNNRVHDAECGDGIDVRLAGTARYRAEVTANVVEDLRQGDGFESLLAIGMQTLDRSRLVARLDRNRQTNLGNEGDPEILLGPAGTDTEGVFVNLDDHGRARVSVDHNTYTNPKHLGGFSANGMELITTGGSPRAEMVIRNSRFSAASGDVLEEGNLGTNSYMSLKLVNVVATRSRGWAESGIGNTFLIPFNNADCLLAGSGGAGNTIELTVRDSRLTDCANNGLSVGSNVVNGEGPMARIDVDVAGSVITGNRGANLGLRNFTDLTELILRVQTTNLSDSHGTGSGAANAAFEDLGATERSAIDLGGGALGSTGRNCLAGGLLAADVAKYDVIAEQNWWGSELGPAPGRTVVSGGSLDADPFLTAPPASCG